MAQKENDEIKNLKNEKEQEKLSQRKKEIQEIINKNDIQKVVNEFYCIERIEELKNKKWERN